MKGLSDLIRGKIKQVSLCSAAFSQEFCWRKHERHRTGSIGREKRVKKNKTERWRSAWCCWPCALKSLPPDGVRSRLGASAAVFHSVRQPRAEDARVRGAQRWARISPSLSWGLCHAAGCLVFLLHGGEKKCCLRIRFSRVRKYFTC